MVDMSLTLVILFICVVAGITLFGGAATFLRHRKMMNRITDQVFSQVNDQPDNSEATFSAANDSADYSCSHCGAALGNETEISPSGDFKCQYCKNWANVHK